MAWGNVLTSLAAWGKMNAHMGQIAADVVLSEFANSEGSKPPAAPKPGEPAAGIKKVSYTHDAMIDLIIANPAVYHGALAAHFGYTPGWISQVLASDAFQARLAARKDELIDPAIRASIEDRMKALVFQSYEVLKKKLESPAVSDDLALGVMKAGAQALGYGARGAGPTVQAQTAYVIQLPQKAASSEAWEKAQKGGVTLEGEAARLPEGEKDGDTGGNSSVSGQ